MRGYLCERCPLAFEIGGDGVLGPARRPGGGGWRARGGGGRPAGRGGGGLDGRLEQAVCRACGTMHRLTERSGGCQVTALPGPVRSLPYVTRTAEWYASRYDQETLDLLAEAGGNPWPVHGEEPGGYEWPFT